MYMCVCKACELNIRQSLKKRDNGNAFNLRWKKNCKGVKCCIPGCVSKSTTMRFSIL